MQEVGTDDEEDGEDDDEDEEDEEDGLDDGTGHQAGSPPLT